MPFRLQQQLAAGATSAQELLRQALARIDDPAGEGARTYTRLWREAAAIAAETSDRLRAHGIVPSPLAGVPISIKDLFDVAGEPTLAGSIVLNDAPPATQDAAIVARLRAAGAVLVGKTNMTEFAFSGVGWNPHYDTPANPFDRAMRRIPGGSSSGAAVSVADDMAVAAIGTDTGGSVRIPAALCGLVGFKPTARRVPLDGCLPLSPSLDSIGPLARSVDMCTVVDAVLSGDTAPLPSRPPLRGRRLLVPTNYVIDGMEPAVADAYGRALDRLAKAGAILTEAAVPELADLPGINAKGGFSAPEALAWHRDLLLAKGDAYDRRVRARMERALGMTAVDYIDLLRRRREVQQAVARQLQPFDALVMPTVPIVAPPIAAIAEDDAEFTRVNLLLLRNPSVVNFLDGCALTLPCHRPGEAPVGLSLVGLAMQDRAILGLGRAVESALVAV